MSVRQVVLDTETTGLEPGRGHRLVEIGCIELCERRRSGRRFQRYLDPEREIDQGALEVHGLSREFLREHPRFAEVADEFLAFIEGAELVIHNAPFDVSFLDHELARVGGRGCIADHATVLDTLAQARERYPGQRNSLDALCRRFGVDASQRELHGALLDASLLADVYLAMTAGQGDLALAVDSAPARAAQRRATHETRDARLRLVRADAAEMAAHGRRLDALDGAGTGACLWRRLEPDDGSAGP
jgi:DNA polymerase-3 subunit epsilon